MTSIRYPIVEYFPILFLFWKCPKKIQAYFTAYFSCSRPRLLHGEGCTVFHPAINIKDDSDPEPETKVTSKITKEDVIIKERKSLDKVHKFYSHFWFNCSIQEMLRMVLKLAIQHVERY